jgi:serine protease
MIHNRRPITGKVALRRSPKGLLTACWFVALAAACLVLFSNTSFAQGPDPDRFIVQFKERGNSAAARQAISAAGGSVLLEVPAVNAVAARIPAQALQGLRNNPNIALIEQDSPRFPMAQTLPYGITMVQADQITEGQPGSIKVCVIDSGFDAGHEDLIGATVDGTDLPRSGGGLNLWNTDSCGHGTHVAGTIMAQDNAVGVVGVTPQVSLHIVKVFDGENCGWTYASSTLNAAYACRDAGAKVINMSLGCVDSGRGGPWACANSTENNGFQSLYDQGILSVASAGNAGTTQRSYPASYASVVSVAAVDSAEQVASFSQQNSDVELAAPGVAVRSTVPMGKGSEESLTVSGVRYEAIAMEGSPSLTRSGALANCGKALTTCTAASGGRVCLIERGDISFADKVLNCQAGGGTAAVIYNNAPGLFSGTVSGAGTSIPSVGISQQHGQWLLLNRIGASSTVAVGPGNYAYYDGTSMAAPHVAGVAALVWSHNPDWNVGQIREALQVTAKDLGASGKDNAYGYGLVKASDALAHLNGGTPPPPPPPPSEENGPPIASFTYNCAGLTCSFDGSGSTDSDGTIASYAWNFGDGTAGTGVNATRSYAAGGTYTVILTVTDNGGLTGTTSQPVTVTAPPTGGISLTANAYKVQGLQKVDLSWNGATGTSVDIFRDGSQVTVANSGAYTDHINVRGGGTYTYRVCEAGTSICSPDVNASF